MIMDLWVSLCSRFHACSCVWKGAQRIESVCVWLNASLIHHHPWLHGSLMIGWAMIIWLFVSFPCFWLCVCDLNEQWDTPTQLNVWLDCFMASSIQFVTDTHTMLCNTALLLIMSPISHRYTHTHALDWIEPCLVFLSSNFHAMGGFKQSFTWERVQFWINGPYTRGESLPLVPNLNRLVGGGGIDWLLVTIFSHYLTIKLAQVCVTRVSHGAVFSWWLNWWSSSETAVHPSPPHWLH